MDRAIDEETRTVGTLDFAVMPEIEKDPRMPERPAAAVAGGDRLINVDGFKRPHVRLKSTPGREGAKQSFEGLMIRIAARQSTAPCSLIGGYL